MGVTSITGSLITQEGCASLADANGNLMFYTDGSTIYTKTHTVMANGTGLNGNASTTQAGIIVQKPGSANIFYVFSLNVGGATLYYSTIDMSLAAGFGSVTIKNTSLTPNCNEKLTSVKHANGNDVWVLTHENGTSNDYKAFLVTSTGVSTTAVISSIGASGTAAYVGYLKFSPNGTKLGAANYTGQNCEIFDFNPTNGAITNSLALPVPNSYGCEFSPDGTKFFASSTTNKLFQFDLCAGINTAIIASQYTVSTGAQPWAMQLATNGKIYVTRYLQQMLGVINSPNTGGSGCNYVDQGQSISPNVCRLGFPNFITSGFKPPPPPFTHTVSNLFGCQTASFTAPQITQNFTLINCMASGFSLTGMQWNFGNPQSGANNTSTLVNPSHAFTNLGTYTVSLILFYNFGWANDTIKQQVIINQPCISVSSTSITCANLGSATVQATGGIGPYSYTWMPTNQSGSVATGLAPGSYTLTVFDFGNNFTYTAIATFNSLIPLAGNLNHSGSITCNGASTGTANFSNLSGGSPNQNYLWTNGQVTLTTQNVTGLAAGVWNANVTDALTGCSIVQLFLITQPPPVVVNVAASSPSSCVAGTISVTGTVSGGTPGYQFAWSAAMFTSATPSLALASEPLAGNYSYTLNGIDANNCIGQNTISLNFVPIPTLSIADTYICPFETGTLNVSGATSYSWSNNTFTNFIAASPTVSTQYSVTGQALGCIATTFAFIYHKPVPVPVFVSNSPLCNGQLLQLDMTAYAAYNWNGPQGFLSNNKNPIVNPAAPINSGIYNVTVTAANACTASTSGTVLVNPTPTVIATGATICVDQALNLSSSSAGSSFFWNGPIGFTSPLQNPNVFSPAVQKSGFYTVTATSAAGCTNTAIAHVTVTALPQPILSSNAPKCFGENLNLAVNGALSYAWSGPNNFSSNLQFPAINNLPLAANGVYTVVSTTGPCVVTNTMNVIVYPLPSPTITTNMPVCEGKQLQLSVNNQSITTVMWMGPNNFASASAYASVDPTQLLHSGVYNVTVIDIHNCQNATSASVTILENPILITTGAEVCFNDPATLNVTGADSYFWKGPQGYFAFSQQAPIQHARNVTAEIFTVTATGVNGCTTIATAALKTIPLPFPSLAADPATRKACLYENLKMEGFGGTGYEWSGPGSFYFLGKNLDLKLSSPDMAGIYTLTVFDKNGCKDYTTALISVDVLPTGNVKIDKQQDCSPFCTEIKFLPVGRSQATWQIGTNTYTTNSLRHCFTRAGDYAIELTISDKTSDCKAAMKYYIHARPQPNANFSYLPENPIENTDEVQFTNLSEGENLKKWTWYFGEGLEETTTTNKEHGIFLYKNAGTFPVALVVEDQFGCRDTSVKRVVVQEDFNLFVPNVFTPNGDGINEIFQPVGRGVRQYELILFDRWGHILFESNELKNGWDGNYKNDPSPVGAYNWKIVVTSDRGESKTLNGHVLLKR